MLLAMTGSIKSVIKRTVSTRCKVLVVEDDPTTQKILEKILTRDISLRYLDLQVTLASNGAEGLDRFRAERPDLIITDLLMPKVDGFKLLEAIRSAPEGKSIPVIVLTAVFRDSGTQARLEHGYGAVLHNKPFSPKQLAKQIAALLPPSARPCPPEAPPAPFKPAAAAPIPAPRPNREGDAAHRGHQGTLANMPVPRLLLEAAAARFSGSLDLRRGKARKLIHILGGQPIFVQSNLRGETLGQLMIRRGVLTPEQNAEALRRSEKDGIKYGEALVRLGLMTEAQVMAELVTQTRLKIESCLPWRSGSYGLVDDPAIGQKMPHCTVDAVTLVFEGMRRHPDLDDAFQQLAAKGSFRLALKPAFERHRVAFIAASGQLVIDAIAGASGGEARTVAEVIQATGSPHEAVLQIDALLRCGLGELIPPPKSSTDERVTLSRPAVERSISLEHLATLTPEPPSPAPSLPKTGNSPREDSAVIWIGEQPKPRVLRPAPPVDPERTRVALQLIQATYLGLHDADHYQILGVTPQTDSGSIEVAYRIKRRQFDPSAFQDVDLGEQRDRLDEISAALDAAFATLADPARRAEYDRNLQNAQRQRLRNNALRAEELCREGEDFFERRCFAEAEMAFGKACQLDDQPQYHAQHALARFMASGGSPQVAEEAMVEVQVALAADPGDTTCYLTAAKIARSLGHNDEALANLRKLIKIDPSCQEGFDEAEDLLLEEEQYEVLEAEYRRTLHLVGDQDPAWSALLWHRLALFYRDQLHDQDRARLACAAALRLKPNDRDLHGLVAELDGGHPDRWPEAVLGYRSLLRSDPEQTEPLHEIFRLHLSAGRLDAAYQAASAAKLRGKVSPEEESFLGEHRPAGGGLVGARSALPAAAWEKLRHPDDDQGLANLFGLLGPWLERRHPLRLADFDVETGELIARDTLPPIISQALEYVSARLELSQPSLALKQNLCDDVQALATDPAVVLLGDGALACDDLVELCFRFGRALAPLHSGRRVTLGRSRHLLRLHLMAAVSASLPEVKLRDADGAVARAASELKELPELLAAVRLAVLGLRQRFERLSLSDWEHGIQRTAERVALLLCGDLCVAGKILRGLEPDAEVELVDFALSEAYGELRSELGLTVI